MLSNDKAHGRSGIRYALAGVILGLLAVYGLGLQQPARVSAAANTYNGGVDTADAPVVMLNDHTVYSIRFSASGLETSTPYYAKVRISPVRTGQGQERNRGFTWNKVTGTWVHERDAWTLFPQISTDASGNIPLNDASWLYTKFSDETTTGTYYIVVSLSKTGVSSTLNASVVQTITVVNAATQGGWVHNENPASPFTAGKRVDAVGDFMYAMSRAETNTVDDDSDGTVDNENWAFAAQAGSFRLGVPADTTFTVRAQKTPWAPGTDRKVLVPDTDIALGATDQVAPTAPGAPSAVASPGKITVSWGAATDDQGLHGYYVYRWNDPVPIDGLLGVYTSVPVRIATVGAGATSYEDMAAPFGKTAYYQVRAVDDASNVGPRSTVASALPASIFIPVYRFYNFKQNTHFYTANPDERANVIAKLSKTYRDEGVAYSINTANPSNDAPLYRFYNFKKNTHFYTANPDERANVIAKLSNTYRDEGIAYDVCVTNLPGSTPVYRFYNFKKNTHFYTANPDERANVIAKLSNTYRDEGVAFYLAP